MVHLLGFQAFIYGNCINELHYNVNSCVYVFQTGPEWKIANLVLYT
jgi:hypothetical protein